MNSLPKKKLKNNAIFKSKKAMKFTKFCVIGIMLAMLLVSCKQSSVSTVDMMLNGPDDELVALLKEQARQDSLNKTPEQLAAEKAEKEHLEKIMAAREEERKRLGIEEEQTTNSHIITTSAPDFLPYVFAVLMILAIAFPIILAIRKVIKKAGDMSYTIGEMTEIMDQISDDPRFKDLPEEERKNFEKFKNFIDK